MPSGENQKKSVATIDSDTFEVEIFHSLSDCAKKLNTSVKAVSRVANDKSYYSHKGKTIVFYTDYNKLNDDIIKFKEKRFKVENCKYELPKTRICGVCKQEFPLTDEFFHKGRNDKYIKNSLKRICKNCRKGEHFEYYNKNKEERTVNSEKQAIYVFKMYKKLDKNYTGFNFTIEWINHSLEKPCIYCGFKSTGFDRIDNSIGHTIDNCVPCCKE